MIGRNSVRRFTQDCILLGVVYLRHALLKRPIVASPAGLEPATCGLEIRCCYPAELRGRDRKLLPQERLHLPAPQRAAPTGIARGSAAWGERRDARTFFLPLFPHGAKLA